MGDLLYGNTDATWSGRVEDGWRPAREGGKRDKLRTTPLPDRNFDFLIFCRQPEALRILLHEHSNNILCKTMAKRKREVADQTGPKSAAKSRKEVLVAEPQSAAAPASKSNQTANRKANLKVNGEREAQQAPAHTAKPWTADTTTVQIVTGSYERVLHGFTATIPQTLVTRHEAAPKEGEDSKVIFSDTFLFNAHATAIRCLALSPPPDNPNGKIFLATGSTDERINLYSVSLCPPAISKNKPQLPTLHGTSITENSRNKELGSLLHHSSSITALYFPTRAKLLSAAEDSTIAITRTRDWTPLSTIKAPVPKPQGRPSGDTAGPGEVPSGVNDFAVHPSMKLMLSVGKGEKCMRLWNLVTGKKAGVLNFSRELLSAVGEGRFGTGEGHRVVWDEEGEEYAVAFERGIVVFGIDSKPKAKIVPSPRTKIHQMHYLPGTGETNILVISTEDGRVLFYDTNSIAPIESANTSEKKDNDTPSSTLIAQLGGPATGLTGRVKDFEIIPISSEVGSSPNSYLITAAGSDGSVRLWILLASDLQPESKDNKEKAQTGFTAKQVGQLIGTYSTGTRITCLKAFVMTGKPDEAEEEEEEQQNGRDPDSSSEGDSE